MLIGRAEAVDGLLALVDALDDGRPRRSLVRGEAGIGKTALLREVGTWLERRGTCSVYGRGDDLDRGRPFRLVVDLAASVAAVAPAIEQSIGDALVEAVRVTTDPGAGSAAAQHVLSDAFLHVVEALAIAGPVVLLVDDLQWADAESASVLRRIGDEFADLPIALLGAARPGALPWDLDRTFGPEVERPLEPLRIEDLEELAGATVGAAPGPLLVHELGRSGGNPFIALELIRALHANDRLVFGDGRVDLSALALPDEVRARVLDRIAELDGSVAELLRTASVLGSSFRADELDLLAGIQGSEDALAGAVRLGLLERSDAGAYTFRHDLVRAALYDALQPAELPRLHQRAVTTLAVLGAPSTRLASHLMRSESADDATLDLLERAAWDLQRSSASSSLELADRCLALVEPGSPRYLRLLTGMIEPLLYLGRFVDAERVGRTVLADGGTNLDLDVRLEVWHDLVVAVVRQDDGARAMEDIAEILRTPNLRPSDEAVMRLLRAQGTLQQGRIEEAADDAEFAIAVGEARGDDRLLMGGWLILAIVAGAQGHMARATDCGRRAEEHHGVDGAIYLAELWHAVVLIGADEMTVGLRTLHQGRERARARGDLSSQATYDWATAALHYTTGNFDDCLAEVETGRMRITAGQGTPQQVLVGRSVAARIHVHRGDLDAARAEVERGDAELAAGAVVGGDLFLWAKALLLEHDGDELGALVLLELAFEMTGGVPFLLSWRTFYPELVRLALVVGRTDLVDRVVAGAAAGAAAGGDLASARGCALFCRGLADGDLDLLVRATAAYRRSPRLPDLARCAEATGNALARVGRAEEAVQLLREAARIHAGQGAVTELHRIEQALRTLDLPTARTKGRSSIGWDSLTPSEVRVAALVAEGMTTPAIARGLLVSPNTVSTHIRHIFAKLGVNSRSAVAGEAVRHLHAGAP